MLVDDMRRRGLDVATPTDLLADGAFIARVAKAYDIGGPTNIPPDAVDRAA